MEDLRVGSVMQRRPAQDTCDYLDNNCDGVVDEDFLDEAGKYSTLEDAVHVETRAWGLFRMQWRFVIPRKRHPSAKWRVAMMASMP